MCLALPCLCFVKFFLLKYRFVRGVLVRSLSAQGGLRAYIFPEVIGRGGGGACTDLLAECLPADAHLSRGGCKSAKRWVRAHTPVVAGSPPVDTRLRGWVQVC